MKEHEIITDTELDEVWGNANFGNISKRDVIGETLMKYACGFSSGHTAFLIVNELGLIYSDGRNLNKKGQKYLYAFFERINTERIIPTVE